ncbi:MAG: DUF1538 domain-containing protein [Dermatophilaceae bacterium]
MREYAQDLLRRLRDALLSLVPIVAIVAAFQAFVIGEVPPNLTTLVVGMLVVAVGIAVFLQGLDLSVFPLGRSLASQFTRRRALGALLAFGFCIGAAAVIAEPALIAVADQAEIVSAGRIDALTLRILIAVSVGAVIVLGIVRAVVGWRIHWFVIIGYLIVILVTYLAPPEVVGLAYDSGGVTTNIVTVPLIAAIGLGLAGSLQGRTALLHGFGLVALAVMVPMVTVQIYGMLVYRRPPPAPLEPVTAASVEPVEIEGFLDLLGGLAGMLGDVALLVLVVLGFQLLVLRRGVPRPARVTVGFVLVLLGLYAFVVGLKMGLLPLGTLLAEQLIARDMPVLILLFAFLIGFATTLAEPALVAIGAQAQQAAPGRVRAGTIRFIVAIGVGVGITVGVYRILAGDPLHVYVIVGYSLAIGLTLLAPATIVALAFDLGGVTTSEITVPVVTALGIGLALGVEGRDPLIDGFGLIAFASLFPVVTVLSYAIIQDRLYRRRAR